MILDKVEIRKTNTNDFNNIMEVEKLAFGYDKEAKLTADLLADKTAQPYLSLLAFIKNEAVGHVLFTRAYLNEKSNKKLIHLLAPLAVKPKYQKMSIGGLLIKEGITRLKSDESELLFVLGHMEYYPKFGFIPDAKKLGYEAPYPIPDKYADAWMVQPLNDDLSLHEKGKIICADALNHLEHWRE